VLAVLHGPDGGQGVPVVGRGDGDDVDVLVLDDLADVLDVFRLLALAFGGNLHRRADDRRVGVADGGHDAVVFAGVGPDVTLALAANADAGDAELLAGGAFFLGGGFFRVLLGGAGRIERAGRRGQAGQERRILQEIATS